MKLKAIQASPQSVARDLSNDESMIDAIKSGKEGCKKRKKGVSRPPPAIMGRYVESRLIETKTLADCKR